MRAIILTKSYKTDKNSRSGWCVVAYNANNHELVRFVDEGGTGIPKEALDRKDIQVMDVVSVDVKRRCPCGPQVENVLVDPDTFVKVDTYGYSFETLLKYIPRLPEHEPKFMDDTDKKCVDVSKFAHSIEIIRVSSLRSDMYFDRRLCRFSSYAGENGAIRITDPEYYLRDEDWEVGDADIIVTIPINTWKKENVDYGYFKFVAAVYPV